MLKTTVGSPWGARQPDPNFDRSMKIYELALTTGLRSPFAPVDELIRTRQSPTKKEKAETKKDGNPTARRKKDEGKSEKTARRRKSPSCGEY